MEDKLYLVTVNQTIHYYVRCPSKIIESWLAMVVVGYDSPEQDVACTEIKLSDLDEISHLHFC